MIDELKPLFDKMSESMAELEALVDQVSSRSVGMELSKATQILLLMRAAKDRLEATEKVVNRNLGPLQVNLARTMAAQDLTSVDMHAHKFTAYVKGHYAPPSKTKEPQVYDNLLTWLNINMPGVVQEVTTMKVGGDELSDLCQKRREDGLELPPGVKEHTEIRVQVRKK